LKRRDFLQHGFVLGAGFMTLGTSCVTRSDITGSEGGSNGGSQHHYFEEPVTLAAAMGILHFEIASLGSYGIPSLVTGVTYQDRTILNVVDPATQGLIFRISGTSFPLQSAYEYMVHEGDTVTWLLKSETTGEESGRIIIPILSSSV